MINQLAGDGLRTCTSTYLLIYWLQEVGFPDDLWHLPAASPNWKLGYVKDIIKTRTFLHLYFICPFQISAPEGMAKRSIQFAERTLLVIDIVHSKIKQRDYCQFQNWKGQILKCRRESFQ